MYPLGFQRNLYDADIRMYISSPTLSAEPQIDHKHPAWGWREEWLHEEERKVQRKRRQAKSHHESWMESPWYSYKCRWRTRRDLFHWEQQKRKNFPSISRKQCWQEGNYQKQGKRSGINYSNKETRNAICLIYVCWIGTQKYLVLSSTKKFLNEGKTENRLFENKRNSF